MSNDTDLLLVADAIENILDVANRELQSGLVAVGDLESLGQAIKTFDISVAAILRDLPPQSKLNLVSIINSVFTIGETCGLSKTVVKKVRLYRRHRHSAKMRKTKAQKPRQKAIDEAIDVVGSPVTSRFYKEATVRLDGANRWLERHGHEPVSVDVIYRRLKSRAAKKPRS
jgi:hypothetical protein